MKRSNKGYKVDKSSRSNAKFIWIKDGNIYIAENNDHQTINVHLSDNTTDIQVMKINDYVNCIDFEVQHDDQDLSNNAVVYLNKDQLINLRSKIDQFLNQ